MKKLMFAAAVVAAGVAMADVTSANIVGYNTININKEYTLLTVNFEAVDGGALTLEQAFPWTEGMTEAKSADAADNIQVMNSEGGYETYFRWNGASGKSGTADPTLRAWALEGKTAASDAKLSTGDSMWYQSRSAKLDDPTTAYNITIAGGVSLAEKFEYTLDKEYTLVGNPFPCEVPLNGGVILTEPTRAKSADSADNVQIMTPEGGYDTYFAWNGASGKSGSADPAQEGWSLEGKTAQTDANFPVGRGAWFQTKNPSSTAKLRFVNPVGKTAE